MSGAAIAIVIAKARQRVVGHFTDANATASDRAVAFNPERRIEKRMLKAMLDFGALREVGQERYWLDEKRYADFRKERLARVLGILAVAGFAVAGAMFAAG